MRRALLLGWNIALVSRLIGSWPIYVISACPRALQHPPDSSPDNFSISLIYPRSASIRMSSLNTLPNELLLGILEYIHAAYSPCATTFRSLCLTSRRVHQLTRPFLYRFIAFKVTSPAATLLTRTLLDNPMLADHVRALDVAIDIPRFEDATKDTRHERNDVVISKFRDAVGKFNYPRHFSNEWKGIFKSKDEQGAACAALIMLRCPRLEEVHLRWNGYGTTRRMNPWPIELLSRLPVLTRSDSQQVFCKLHTIKLSQIEGLKERPGRIRVIPYIHLLNLPNLAHFEIQGCFEQTPEPWFGEDPSPLETLVFRRSEVKIEDLRFILQVCVGLKHFHYDISAAPFHNRQQSLDHARLSEALKRHANTLETLHIGFSSAHSAQIWDTERKYNQSSLHLSSFSRLRKVCVSVHAVFPMSPTRLAEQLPHGLQELSLFAIRKTKDWDASEEFDPLEKLADDLSMFPDLRRIQICSTAYPWETWVFIIEKFARANIPVMIEPLFASRL